MEFLRNGGADILTQDMDLERRGLVLVGNVWGGEKMDFDEVDLRGPNESQQGFQSRWRTKQGLGVDNHLRPSDGSSENF